MGSWIRIGIANPDPEGRKSAKKEEEKLSQRPEKI
jgi:hypothetical protein